MNQLDFHLSEQKRAEDELQLLKMGLAATASEDGKEMYRQWIRRKEEEIERIGKSAKFYLQKMNTRHYLYWFIGALFAFLIVLKI